MGAGRCIVRGVRGGFALALFAVFGIGSLLLAPLAIVLGRPDRCHPVVRALWRLFAWMCVHGGLIGIDAEGLRPVRGCIIAANHPSLIDVILVTALLPRTLFAAKHALEGNPFLGAIVRNAALPGDAGLVEAAGAYLERGWNVLVFPEGTRSPRPDAPGPLRRGVAQLALRSGAPVVCVGIRLSRPILGKRQKPWDMGDGRAVYAFRSDGPVATNPDPSRPLRAQAEELTAGLARRIAGLMDGDVPGNPGIARCPEPSLPLEAPQKGAGA